MQTPTEAITQNKYLEQSANADRKQHEVQKRMFFALHHRNDESQDKESNDCYLSSQYCGAGQQIFCAHAKQDPDIHGPLHDENIGEGKRKER